jgi:hypothetical protein
MTGKSAGGDHELKPGLCHAISSVDTNPIRRICIAEAVYNGKPLYTGGLRVEYADGCAQQVSQLRLLP